MFDNSKGWIQPDQSTVFVVATPIGNLGDLTPRAREVLANVDVIAAEDTRRTRQLLQLAVGNWRGELVSYHDHNEGSASAKLIDRMQKEVVSMALVSDAGTPCISDPGFRLVSSARDAGVRVTPVPGPSALTALVSTAGLACHRFLFVGFLPTKRAELDRELRSWSGQAAVISYLPARRLPAVLEQIMAIFPDAKVAIGRELTKMYEEITVASISDARTRYGSSDADGLKGEVVLMVEPPSVNSSLSTEELRARIVELLTEGYGTKQILTLVTDSGLSRKNLYDYVLKVKNELAE